MPQARTTSLGRDEHGRRATGWTEQAACSGKDSGLWFRGDVTSTAIARSICASCPVRAECLDDARSSSFLVSGMWGGLTEQERRSGPDE